MRVRVSIQVRLVRAVKATVRDDVLHGRVGWSLDKTGLGIGRHFAKHIKIPLGFSSMQGVRNRTALIESWFTCNWTSGCADQQKLTPCPKRWGSRTWFFLVGARCLSAGRTWDSRVDQQGFEPPPAVCRRWQDQRHTNWAIGSPDEVRGRDIGNQDSLMPAADGREIPTDSCCECSRLRESHCQRCWTYSWSAGKWQFFGISQSGPTLPVE